MFEVKRFKLEILVLGAEGTARNTYYPLVRAQVLLLTYWALVARHPFPTLVDALQVFIECVDDFPVHDISRS